MNGGLLHTLAFFFLADYAVFLRVKADGSIFMLTQVC